MATRQIPEGSGINGRPILSTPPGVRHLAYWRPEADCWGYTWCGVGVPAEHSCPTADAVAKAPPYVMKNCAECHRLYLAGERAPASWRGLVLVEDVA